MILSPGTSLSYADLLSPSLLAFLCTLPTLLTIRVDRLNTTQLVIRKILQILLIEAIVLTMVNFGFHGINSIGGTLTVAFFVLLVFAGVSLIDWVKSCLEAEELNRRLIQMQRKEGEK